MSDSLDALRDYLSGLPNGVPEGATTDSSQRSQQEQVPQELQSDEDLR
jgi:hypothetical protein